MSNIMIFSFKFPLNRVFRTDLAVGGDLSPPNGGGPMGGDTGLMGGDSRVIRDII